MEYVDVTQRHIPVSNHVGRSAVPGPVKTEKEHVSNHVGRSAVPGPVKTEKEHMMMVDNFSDRVRRDPLGNLYEIWQIRFFADTLSWAN
jgi:hypothetical protein